MMNLYALNKQPANDELIITTSKWSAFPCRFSTLFYQVNRTVCPISPQQRPANLPLFYIDVFSSSTTPVDYIISVEAIEDFEMKLVCRNYLPLRGGGQHTSYFSCHVVHVPLKFCLAAQSCPRRTRAGLHFPSDWSSHSPSESYV